MSDEDEGFTDCWIFPPQHGPITRPSATFTAPHTGPVDQRTDNSVGKRVNEALPWVSAILAGFAAGGVLVMCLLQPWDNADRATAAEIRADFAQRTERTELKADAALKQSGIAKDMMDVERAKRMAREELNVRR